LIHVKIVTRKTDSAAVRLWRVRSAALTHFGRAPTIEPRHAIC
jgi:hypothetical protein